MNESLTKFKNEIDKAIYTALDLELNAGDLAEVLENCANLLRKTAAKVIQDKMQRP